MGVTGLLPQLKEIQRPTNLASFKGKTLAVDTYGWLHKATISCAQELCQDLPTQKYITSVMKKVHMLRHFGVEPYMVFDGASLPTKAATAAERRVKREEAQRKADEYISRGNKSLAWKEFMKAAGVTSPMAKSIMAELDRFHVKYVVAPYEADPQMVYLEKIGLVDGIISEDSDLLVFGCKRLVTKLNDYGDCIEINKCEFDKLTSLPGLVDFSPQQFRLLAMLSGCDYTKGIPGVGLKTAFNLIKKYNNVERVLMAIRAEGKKVKFSEDFEDELIKADLAFQFQKVFDPRAQCLSTLNEYPEGFSFEVEYVESCCGLTLEQKIHVGICNGKLHPNTHEFLVSREQNLAFLKGGSVTQGTKSNAASKIPKGKASASKSKALKPKKMWSIDSFFDVKKAVVVKETVESSETVESVTVSTISTVSEPMKSVSKPMQKTVSEPVKASEPLEDIDMETEYMESETVPETSDTVSETVSKPIQPPTATEPQSSISFPSLKKSFGSDVTDPKVSPLHKRTKKATEFPKETPKLRGKFSKFFKTPPSGSLQTPKSTTFGSDDITGDSDITEPSSPFAHTKQPQVDTKQPQVDTNNVLGSLTDDDEESSAASCKSSTGSFATAKDTDSILPSDTRKLEDFDLDQDDEIEESPIKGTDFTGVPGIHTPLENHNKVRKLLWENFSFDPNSAKKFEFSESFKAVKAVKK